MKKHTTVKVTGMLLLGVMLASACTQTYSQTPLGTPSLIPTGLFVSPIAGGQDPLKVVSDIGTQTAAARTAVANGGTPVVAGTPIAAGSPNAAGTQTAGVVATALAGGGTAAPASGSTPIAVTVNPNSATSTPLIQSNTAVPGSTVVAPTFSGAVPSSYTLQKGEWPFCIARRYNVNPNELLNQSGLSQAESSMLMPGRVLTMPTTGDPFPGTRAWHNHPNSFTVDSSDTTISGVACYYGDLDPQSIATANNLTLSSALNAGQVLKIP